MDIMLNLYINLEENFFTIIIFTIKENNLSFHLFKFFHVSW